MEEILLVTQTQCIFCAMFLYLSTSIQGICY